MTVLHRWRDSWSARWQAWWTARLPRKDDLRLTQRNVYILPTRAGWGFAVVILILLAASINEQINLGYALTFLLAGTGLAVMYQTHSNLQGLRLSLLAPHGVHAGQAVRLTVQAHNDQGRKHRLGLRLGFSTRFLADKQTSVLQDLTPFEVTAGGDTTVELETPATRRGWMDMPTVVIETGFPMGFFRVWAYWRPHSRVLIWPALEPHPPALPESTPDQNQAVMPSAAQRHADIPDGLRDYRRGDPLRWIAWKKSSHALASGTGLVTREPVRGRSPDLWLDFDASPGMQGLALESRLSRLASWLVSAEQVASDTGSRYGLRLPGVQVDCDSGPHHLKACLDALATWPTPSAEGHA